MKINSFYGEEQKNPDGAALWRKSCVSYDIGKLAVKSLPRRWKFVVALLIAVIKLSVSVSFLKQNVHITIIYIRRIRKLGKNIIAFGFFFLS